MSRPRIRRRVQINPDITYFKPRSVPLSSLEEVNLDLDELEAIRLKDMQSLSQNQSARKMKISVTTFQRIIDSAHKKIADALIRGKAISIRKEVMNMPNKDGTGPTGVGRGRGRQSNGFGMGPGGDCICPSCNTKAPHKRGVPCYEQQCPKCGETMTRAR